MQIQFGKTVDKTDFYDIINLLRYAAILAVKTAIMSKRRCREMAVTANYETVMIISMKKGEEAYSDYR